MNKEFQAIRKELSAFDSQRESMIKESRSILKNAKQAVYALHRDDFKQAKKLLAEAKSVKEKLEKVCKKDLRLRTGGFSAACEEYAEALILLEYLQTGKLLPLSKVGVTTEEYLGGVADVTGELGRIAVIAATARDVTKVQSIKDFTEEIYGEFVQCDFRNGELRRKYDAMKYNLQKMERVLYDLSMHGGSNE